jgi:hypothetical protein
MIDTSMGFPRIVDYNRHNDPSTGLSPTTHRGGRPPLSAPGPSSPTTLPVAGVLPVMPPSRSVSPDSTSILFPMDTPSYRSHAPQAPHVRSGAFFPNHTPGRGSPARHATVPIGEPRFGFDLEHDLRGLFVRSNLSLIPLLGTGHSSPPAFFRVHESDRMRYYHQRKPNDAHDDA